MKISFVKFDLPDKPDQFTPIRSALSSLRTHYDARMDFCYRVQTQWWRDFVRRWIEELPADKKHTLILADVFAAAKVEFASLVNGRDRPLTDAERRVAKQLSITVPSLSHLRKARKANSVDTNSANQSSIREPKSAFRKKSQK